MEYKDKVGKILRIVASVFFGIIFLLNIVRFFKAFVASSCGMLNDVWYQLTSSSSFFCSLLLCLILFALGEIIDRMGK